MWLTYGVFVHTDCWKYIYNQYKIKLKYGDLFIDSPKNYNKVIEFLNYDKIDNYWSQDFDFLKTIIDNNEYLCTSPLLKNKNISIIKSNFIKLKIRNTEGRKSPLQSGTLYKNNIYKIGENDKIWYTQSNKWIELKDNIIEIKKELPKNYKFSKYDFKYIGEHNTKPIFIKSIDLGKKSIVITWVCSDKLKN